MKNKAEEWAEDYLNSEEGKTYIEGFSKSWAEEALKASTTMKYIPPEPPEHIIGIDTYDEDCCAYTLARIRKNDGVMEVLLSKTNQKKKEFDKEVKNLSKYFDARIIKDFDT